MVADRTGGGRGRYSVLAAFSSAAILIAVAVISWAIAAQVPAPPSPGDGGAGTVLVAGSTPSPTASSAAEPTTVGATSSAPTTASAGRRPSTSSDARAAGTPTTEPTAEPTTGPAEPAIAALPRSEPVRVRIPAIDVSSPLHPLGLEPDGMLQVPSGDRYDQAAWYDGSPTPGEVGPAVVLGHVTSQGSVPSVFFELGAVEIGDTVLVERADGTTATFEVYAVDSFPKDSFPKVEVYGNTSGPELRVITCGGVYDPAGHRHLDNIVVFARLQP